MLAAYRQTFHRMADAAKSMLPRSLCVTRLREGAGNTVLLTFDDGPDPSSTLAVLSRLRHFKARAIFFVVGWRIKKHPHLLAQILSEGHWLGNHSFTHTLRSVTRFDEYSSDLGRCQEFIYEHTKTKPRFYRPPLGQLSLASLMASRQYKLVTILWSNSTEDWRFHSDVEAVSRAEDMVGMVKPQDILLFHEAQLHTVAFLDRFLPGLQARGFSFSPQIEHIV